MWRARAEAGGPSRKLEQSRRVTWSRGQQCGWEEALRFCIDFEDAMSGDCFDMRYEKKRRVKDATKVFVPGNGKN